MDYTVKSPEDLNYDVPDAELDAILAGKHPAFQSKRGENKPTTQMVYTPPPHMGMEHKTSTPLRDVTMGMSTLDLARAGAGKVLDDWFKGIANKATLLNLPKDPTARQAVLDRMAAEKKDKTNVDRLLATNPAANFGSMVPEVAASVAAPVRLGAQSLVQGALSALSSPPKATSATSEFAGSALQGGLGALGTYGAGKVLMPLGNVYNAIMGRYTPAGSELMATSDAARRLGMPPPSIGELDPNSIMGLLHSSSFSRPARSRTMGTALKSVLSKDVPTAVGPRTVMGKAYEEELQGAIAERYRQAADKYANVDSFVAANGLGNVEPGNTYNSLETIANKFTPAGKTHEVNPVLSTLLEYDPNAFSWLRQLGANPTQQDIQTALKNGVPLSTYHDMRVATNKAWMDYRKAARANPTDWQTKEAVKDLDALRTSLDADARTWATRNSGNAEAMSLYNDANNFYKTVVAPAVLENKVARRLTSKTTPYPTGEALVQDTTNTANRPLVDLLAPTLSDRGADMVQVTRGLPEATTYAVTGKTAPLSPTLGSLGLMANAAFRGPARFVGSALGEMGGLTQTEVAKRLYAAAPLSGRPARIAYGAFQYPAGSLEQYLGDLLGTNE